MIIDLEALVLRCSIEDGSIQLLSVRLIRK